MNPEEARFILSAVKPDRLDDSDANLQEALELLKSDSELRAWYNENCALDAAISEKLMELPPPDDLQAQILAGLKVSNTGGWRRRPVLVGLAAAAAVAISAVVWPILNSEESSENIAAGTVAEFQADMIHKIRNMSGLDYVSNDPESVLTWLGDHGQEIQAAIPAEMVGNPLTGCKVIDWNGNQVTLICFDNPDGSKPALHLVVADASLIKGIETGETRSETVAEWSSDVWRDGDRVYFVAARGETTAPRDLVPFG